MIWDKIFKLEENWVIFYDIFSKNGNGDSIRPLAEELRKISPNMKFFFCTKKKKKYRLNHIDMADEVLVIGSLRFNYVCMKAKYIISNMSFPNKGRKREGQIFVNTWHGSPLKKLYLSRDRYNKKFQRYVKQFEKADYFCVQGIGLIKEQAEALNLDDKQIIKTGLPRNDFLFNCTEEFKSDLKVKLGLPSDKKILLYCPTWRRYDYKAILPFDLMKLKECLQDEYVMLIRSHAGKHTWVDENNKPLKLFDNKFTFNGGEYPEITHLYSIADALITDYSSAMFDFAITNKPQIFYAYDLEDYSKEFGLYKDYADFVPGDIAVDTNSLINSIRQLDKYYEIYNEKYKNFRELYLGFEQGNAVQKVLDYMLGRK